MVRNEQSGNDDQAFPHPEETTIAPARQRAFERARRAALALCSGLHQGEHTPRWNDCIVEPERLERFRLLLVAMGLARGTPGGDAIAALARRGYVIVVAAAFARSTWPARVYRLDTPGTVWFGVGLPAPRRPWRSVERHALKLDLADFPALEFVSAHQSLRIRRDLRREGHDLG